MAGFFLQMTPIKKSKISSPNTQGVVLRNENHLFWSKSISLLTHGILWLVAIYGIFIIPAILKFGSKHSYYGEKINRTQWVIFYVILIIYNSIESIYLGMPILSKKYQIIAFINTILVFLFILAAFINSYILFY